MSLMYWFSACTIISQIGKKTKHNLGHWQRLCFSFHANGLWVVLNGKLLHDDMIKLPDFNASTNEMKAAGIRYVSPKFQGKITEVNF